jgi:hypothetical protein
MYIIRDVFHSKPGQAKALVNIFKNADAIAQAQGMKNMRVLTDTVSTYWTVVLEFEVEEVADYFQLLKDRQQNKELSEAMGGYMDYVTAGHREIFKVE